MDGRKTRKSKQPSNESNENTCKCSVQAAPTVKSNDEQYKLVRYLDGNKLVGEYEKLSNHSKVLLKAYPTVACNNGVPGPNGSRQVMMKLCDHPALSHPHIDQCKDWFTDDNGIFYTEHEWYPGGSLLDAWRAHKPSTWEIVDWVNQLADALENGHEHELLHGDIKLANIMKRGERDFVLSDWDHALNLTDINQKSGVIGFGSDGYMSDEQKCHFMAHEDGRPSSSCQLYSVKTDNYQVGCAIHKVQFSETTDYESVNCETFARNPICPGNKDQFLCESARDLLKANPVERITLSELQERLQKHRSLAVEDTNTNGTFAQTHNITSRIESVIQTQMSETSCSAEQRSSCIPASTETEKKLQPTGQTDAQSSQSSSTETPSMSKFEAFVTILSAPICPYGKPTGRPTTATNENHNDSTVVVVPVTTPKVEPTPQPLSSPANTCSEPTNTPIGCGQTTGGVFLQSNPVHQPIRIAPINMGRFFGRRNVMPSMSAGA